MTNLRSTLENAVSDLDTAIERECLEDVGIIVAYMREALAKPEGELLALRAIAEKAEPMLLEQRREFPRGDLRDLDELEDALNAWRAHEPEKQP